MRYALLIVFVCSLSLPIGMMLGHPNADHAAADNAISGEQLPCYGAEGETAISSSVDDRAMKKHVVGLLQRRQRPAEKPANGFQNLRTRHEIA